MKKNILLVLIGMVYSVTAMGQDIQFLQPWSSFQGDSTAYLKTNFGVESGNIYEFKVAPKILEDVELPFRSALFVLYYNQFYNFYYCSAIYLYFQSAEYVTLRRQQNRFGNCIIMVMDDENYRTDSAALELVRNGRTSSFIIDYDETVREALSKMHFNNAYYSPLIIK